ncbi:MAG TPA: SDR family NAD(P)-dependent oxidoreductase [Solirubrobacteraceae bacterium]
MRSALITGGTGGLGAAVTETFIRSGWRCVVPYTHAEPAERLRDQIADAESRERLELLQADLFDEAQVAHAMEIADDPGAPLEAVVNLIGGFDAPGRVHETPVARFEQQLRVNLRATYLVCAACLPGMLERGAGQIVCVSSRAAINPFPGAAGYVTSKAALLAFVDSMSSEYTAAGIRVNAVLASIIDTQANRASQPDADYSRWVPSQQIADVISFLCSEQSASISGAHIPVYGRA